MVKNKRSILMVLMSMLIFGAIAPAIADTSNPVLKTYGEDDIGQLSYFQGNYINFGYWDGLLPKEGQQISLEQRIESSAALYRNIVDRLHITSTDVVLEIGCGRGNGAAIVAVEYQPATITGIDITPEQIERSKRIHATVLQQNNNLQYMQGSASAIPAANGTVDKIYSVEAAQCFPSITEFGKECFRVLKAGGRLVITAHFSSSPEAFEHVRQLIPTVDQGIDRIIPIQQVIEMLESSGLKVTAASSIGRHVFEGFNRWVEQAPFENAWTRDVYTCYEKGWMDYYVLEVEKPLQAR